MTDQTKWGIDMVQQENKAKAHEEQKDMRNELAFFVMNCTHFEMQELYSEMKRRPYGNEMTKILYNHYLWCKKEGRDTSWYEG